MNHGRLVPALGMCVISACTTTVPGAPIVENPIASSVQLPFKPTIADRSNERNNGSAFEPCTAYTDRQLTALRVDPTSIRDAAFSDSPNYRGCRWHSADGQWTYTQTVGNESALASYKRKQDLRPWNPDRLINDRTVGIALDPPLGCITAFMSQNAVVVSAVRTTTKRTPEPDFKTECEMAVAFATLATTKAP